MRHFQLTGVVVGHETSPPRIVVAHDAVDGLMPAMSMGFAVAGAAPPTRKGDRIVATLVLDTGASWLESVNVIGRSSAANSSPPPQSGATPGAVVPGFTLLDQNGKAITLSDPLGRVTVVTFLYTRCPLPDLCPLLIKHLEGVRRRANAEGLGERLALLGVTLDPAVDTPAVLRGYGESVLEGATRFAQWTLATGTAAQVEDIAGYFGVGYRFEQGFITHTLTTAVVGHDGRIVRMFASNSWRPDDLYDDVRRSIERAVAR